MTNSLPDFEPLTPDIVVLDDDPIQQAIDRSRPFADDPDQQWQAFLQGLAIAGFHQWLTDTAPDLNPSPNFTLPSSTDLNAPVNYQTHGYRLCLLAMGSLTDDRVSLPTAARTDPAHLYIVIEVQEELNQVHIWRGLRHDQLQAHLETHQPQANRPYEIPLTHFDHTPEQILLYLQCLAPEAINPKQPALSTPTPLSPETSTLSPSHPSTLSSPTPLLNVGCWLQNQLDDIAEQFAWTLLPPIAPAMRSPTEELEAILTELPAADVEIPPRACGAYTQVQVGGIPLRLYALTWSLYETGQPEWTLFLFLGPIPGEQLPIGIRLSVRDDNGLLVEQVLADPDQATYLYTQVFGTWNESFAATITLPAGPSLTLPRFGFDPDAS